MCAPFGVNCGFGMTRVLTVGNEDLALEQIRRGRSVQGTSSWSCTADPGLLRQRFIQFRHRFAPSTGHRARPCQPQFWPLAAASRSARASSSPRANAGAPILSNNLDGSNVLAAVWSANFGKVDTQGVDLGVDYYFWPGWRSAFPYPGLISASKMSCLDSAPCFSECACA